MQFLETRDRVLRRRLSWGAGLCGVIWCSIVLNATGAETSPGMPPVADALSADSSFALFLDVGRLKSTGFWKVIEDRLPGLEEQVKGRVADQLGAAANLEKLKGFSDFPWDALSELAISTRGQLDLSPGGKSSRDAAVVATARFTKAADVNGLIEKLLAQAESEKPGTRAKAERSRRKVGSAEVVDIPPELLGDQALPFTTSLAGISAGDSTWLGLGRTETVEGLLRRRGTGSGIPGAKRYVPSGAQVWLYAPIPAEATQALTSGNNSLAQANPMLGPMAEGLKNVREMAAAVTLGERSMDVLVALGCVDGKASSELGAGLQGFLALVQSAAGQRSANNPSFVRNLKLAIDGPTIRLATSMSVADIPASTTARRSEGRAQPSNAAEAAPTKAAAPPVSVEFIGLIPGERESVRWGRVQFRNSSDKAVRTAQLKFNYLDKSGRAVGEWSRRHTDLDSDLIVGPASTRISQTPVFQFPLTAEQVRVTLLDVEFSDGTRWKADR